MKKLFALAALVAVALTSCVKNEVVAPEGEISFKAVNFKNTKAVVTGPVSGATYPATEHFGVYAFHSDAVWSNGYTANPYMENVEIFDQGGSVWKNDARSYYWPKTGYLAFAAYSPYAFGTGTVGADKSKGITFTGFTATNNMDAQIDLMATDIVKDKQKATPVVPVPVAFKHLLSQVKVAVKPAATNYGSNGVESITLDRVVLSGVGSVANYETKATDGTVSADGWSDPATDIEYTFLNAAQNVSLTATDGAAVGKAALVIPQSLASRKFTIDYTINYTGGSKDVITGVAFEVTPAWEMGKVYTYTIAIGVGDEITFTPSVSADWDTTPGSTTISVG